MQKLINYALDRENNVCSLMIVKDGRALFSLDTDTRRPVYSATKSVLSVGIGLLSAEGKIDKSAPLAKYLTAQQLGSIPKNKLEGFERLPITRFLTMSLKGYPFRPEGKSGWIEQALSANIDYAQPPAFSYSNFPALLVGIAAQNAADELLDDFLDSKLFSRLGISRPVFSHTPEGYFYGASGMQLSCKELYLIGDYLLKNAHEDGYLSSAVSKQISADNEGYGYFFWVRDNCFYISGKWGQKCIISPKNNAVITYLCDKKDGDSELFVLAAACARGL